MAKRFIDTLLFDDEWFSDLSQDCKIFWIYFVTKCDHAGMLKYNKKLIEFQTGIKSLERVMEHFDNRIVRVGEMLFCRKYIIFQYPGFPNSNVRQQYGAVEILRKNGLWDDSTGFFLESVNSQLTVNKDLTKSLVHDTDTVHDTVIIKIERKFPFQSEQFKSVWESWIKFRAEIKHKLTPSQESAQLNKLGKSTEQEAIAIIEQSIENGWQGLFPLKNHIGQVKNKYKIQ